MWLQMILWGLCKKLSIIYSSITFNPQPHSSGTKSYLVPNEWLFWTASFSGLDDPINPNSLNNLKQFAAWVNPHLQVKTHFQICLTITPTRDPVMPVRVHSFNSLSWRNLVFGILAEKYSRIQSFCFIRSLYVFRIQRYSFCVA